MTDEEIKSTVLRLLSDVAPEADVASIRPNVNIRDQLDIDSMDFLNFVIAVDKELHVDIPERDYTKLTTLDACTAYVAERLKGSGGISQTEGDS